MIRARRWRFFSLAMLLALATIAAPRLAGAQLRAMGVPIRTTIVISKPAPGQVYGNKQVGTFSVNGKPYKFVIDDAYVDDAAGRVQWPDVWEYVRFHQPNFIIQGQNSDTFEKIKPGDEVTIKGMFAPLDRTLEVVFVQPGHGAFEPEQHR